MLENGELKVLQEIAPQITNFIDVGANKGEWTLNLLNIDATKLMKGVLFEPSVDAFEMLKKNFGGNKNILLENVGLGDVEGEVVFYEEENGGETSSMFKEQNGNSKIKEKIISIRKLDETPLPFEQIDFLKIDAEGNDFFVLKGAEKLLQEGRIKFIQFEYGPAWRISGATLLCAFRYLENYKYKVKAITKDGLKELSPLDTGEFFRYSNWLAYKNELN